MKVRLVMGLHFSNSIGWSSGPPGERGSESWEKTVELPALPEAGETITESWEEGGDFHSINFGVKRRWFDTEGGVGIELIDWQINPTPEMAKHCTGGYRLAWYDDAEEGTTLDGWLLSAGWEGPAQRKAAREEQESEREGIHLPETPQT